MQRPGDLENALTAIVKDPVQGLMVVPSRLTNVTRSQIAAAAIKLEVPMISGWREFAEAGDWPLYGPDRLAITRRLASYIDRILKGTKPATLPARAANEVRAGGQPENRKADRSHDPAERAGAGRQMAR